MRLNVHVGGLRQSVYTPTEEARAIFFVFFALFFSGISEEFCIQKIDGKKILFEFYLNGIFFFLDGTRINLYYLRGLS